MCLQKKFESFKWAHMNCVPKYLNKPFWADDFSITDFFQLDSPRKNVYECLWTFKNMHTDTLILIRSLEKLQVQRKLTRERILFIEKK